MENNSKPKKRKTFWAALVFVMVVIVCLFACAGLWCVFSVTKSNPWNADCVGDIPVPAGYKRVDAQKGDYTSFLRSLPLKPRGSMVQLYTGGNARLQFLSTGVVDMKLISNYEQCADATMRIRAEFFYKNGRYGNICFTDVNGKKMRYQGGKNRASFESYMRKVYGMCSTYSLYRETKPRDILDVKPGDVLVYPAKQGRKYGHAVLVADVAKNKAGKVAIMCIEGNTPAREFHIVRNSANPLRNPWFLIDKDDENIWISAFRFNRDELRHY